MGMKQKWLITGGCGFIGINLIANLLERNSLEVKIRVLDNLTQGTRNDLSTVCTYDEVNIEGGVSFDKTGDVQLIVGDIRDASLCRECCQDIDIVVHLAANTGVGPSVADPREDMECNVVGTFNMLEAARKKKVKRFIFASSGAPIGECEPPIHEELAPHPVSPYGASKLAGEGYCSAYFRAFNLETVALRFGNVYGPRSGHKNSVVAKFIKQAIRNEALEIYGDGGQTRDFIYIDDLVMAIRSAVESKDIGGHIFQIATNLETTIEELASKLIPILKQNGFRTINVFKSNNRVGDVRRNFSDTTKAYNMMNWRVKRDMDSGLQKTVQWFVSTYNKN